MYPKRILREEKDAYEETPRVALLVFIFTDTGDTGKSDSPGDSLRLSVNTP